MSQHKEQQGFVTFAINSTETDYLELAYLQCLNVKATQRHNSYAVLVDTETMKQVTDQHRAVFDYVVELDNVTSENKDGSVYAWSKEPDIFRKTPFKETIKLEADLLFTRSIDHYWHEISKELKQCEEHPSTDTVYAIAAKILGEELVTMPSMDFINFVHMKSGFNGWSDARSWMDTVMHERDGDVIRINNLNQLNPVHYYDKTYATQELIEYYESRISS